jgi:hypothetical protein
MKADIILSESHRRSARDRLMLDMENWTTGDEMARWSEPLIADQACGEYERHLGGKNEVSESLGIQHSHMWRHLLKGEVRSAQSAQRDLLKLAQTVELDNGKLAAINTAILQDLLSVISRRSQSSRKTARLAGMSLMQAAMTLNEIWSATTF